MGYIDFAAIFFEIMSFFVLGKKKTQILLKRCEYNPKLGFGGGVLVCYSIRGCSPQMGQFFTKKSLDMGHFPQQKYLNLKRRFHFLKNAKVIKITHFWSKKKLGNGSQFSKIQKDSQISRFLSQKNP